MIQEFSFSWNGRRWNGYFNAIAHETIIAHFEDSLIRETIGQTLKYSKADNSVISTTVKADVPLTHAGIFDAIQKGVEVQLGQPLTRYFN